MWEHENDDGVVLSATVKKSYFDDSKDEWLESRTFFPYELPIVAALLSQAFQFCTSVQNKQ